MKINICIVKNIFILHFGTMASMENEMMTKFRTNSNIIITGQSHAGKSTFVFSLLKQLHTFESNIRHVLYAYGIWQSLFEQMEKEINHITFYQGIPDKEILEQFTRDYGNINLVLDDVMAQGMNNVDLMNLFTTYSHHMGITFISAAKYISTWKVHENGFLKCPLHYFV